MPRAHAGGRAGREPAGATGGGRGWMYSSARLQRKTGWGHSEVGPGAPAPAHWGAPEEGRLKSGLCCRALRAGAQGLNEEWAPTHSGFTERREGAESPGRERSALRPGCWVVAPLCSPLPTLALKPGASPCSSSLSALRAGGSGAHPRGAHYGTHRDEVSKSLNLGPPTPGHP